MNKKNTLCIIILFVLLLSRLTHSSTIEVSGVITSDTVWDADTVKVTDTVYILDTVQLTITPGTRVEFQGNFFIDVQGTIQAEGTELDSILFTIHDTTGFGNSSIGNGGWGGMRFDSTDAENDSSIFSYCRIEFVKSISYYPYRSGFFIRNFSKVRIEHCMIQNNVSFDGPSPAIFCIQAGPFIKGNTIRDNQSLFIGMESGQEGGGIALFDSSTAIIINNVIKGNYADENGGGIFCGRFNSYDTQNKVIIEGNIIDSNSSGWHGGGGVCCEGSAITLVNNTISNNTTKSGGGGIRFSQCSCTVINNMISSNIVGSRGGAGIYFEYCSGSIINNCIAGNGAPYGKGGGVLIESGDIQLLNNTITKNEARDGGGVSIGCDTINVVNTILWGNIAENGPQICMFATSEFESNFTFCNIQGGSEEIYYKDGCEFNGIYSDNIDADPQFMQIGLHPCALSDLSPCINKGNPDTAGMALPVSDLAGKARVYKDTIDIGAYEYNGEIGILTDQKSVFSHGNNLSITHTNRGIVFTCRNTFTEGTAIAMYDLSGRLMKQLSIGTGTRSVVWDGCNNNGKKCGNGCYIVRLQNAEKTVEKSLVLVQ